MALESAHYENFITIVDDKKINSAEISSHSSASSKGSDYVTQHVINVNDSSPKTNSKLETSEKSNSLNGTSSGSNSPSAAAFRRKSSRHSVTESISHRKQSSVDEEMEKDAGLKYTLGPRPKQRRRSLENGKVPENVQIYLISLEFKDLKLEQEFQKQYGSKNISNARFTSIFLCLVVLLSLIRGRKL